MAPSTRFSAAIAALLISLTTAHPLLPDRTDLSSSTTLPSNLTASNISFGSCPEGFSSAVECATYAVPIDWDNVQGEQFNLSLVRWPANRSSTNSTNKIGTLFINPGGPGGSATAFVAGFAQGALPLPEGLHDAFDIIGLDPRGVGLSNAVTCDEKIRAERVSLFPKTQEEYDALVDKNRRYGESCRNLTGSLVEYVDTISAAKDHEAVRIALGDEPLNMVGLSYGSQLGAQYAALFPENIRTLVLDGMLQHSQSASSNSLIESLGYSLGLSNFFSWASEDETSALRGKDVEGIWKSLLANASLSPLPAPFCDGTTCRTNVTAEELLFNAQSGLIFKSPQVNLGGLSTWTSLASALYNATNGDASAFSATFATTDAGTAIYCLDLDHEPSVYDFTLMRSQQAIFNALKPLNQGACQSTALLHNCVGWPIAPRNPPQKLDVKSKTTILMVNSDADPSTAFPWAVGMLEEIRNKAFVTRIGDGHTSLLTGGETAGMIAEYLLSGVAPEDGIVLQS